MTSGSKVTYFGRIDLLCLTGHSVQTVLDQGDDLPMTFRVRCVELSKTLVPPLIHFLDFLKMKLVGEKNNHIVR